MRAPPECAIDTTVLQKANAVLAHEPRARRQFRVRLVLLRRIDERELVVLISKQLKHEYDKQVSKPRNDYVRAFLELLTSNRPGRVIVNWKKRWSGSDRDRAFRQCRFPPEDEHVLRTAIRGHPSFIVTEEGRMLVTDGRIYRHFRVHIRRPDQV
jgi:predicted nucleic acid-binding protein